MSYCYYYYYYSILQRFREAGQVILLVVVVDMFYQDGNEFYVVVSVHFLTHSSSSLRHLEIFSPPFTMKPTSKKLFINYFKRLET